MVKPKHTPITAALAEEICTRSNSDAVVQGSISSLGARYILTLTATDCSGDHVFGAGKAEVTKRDDVASAIDQLIVSIRDKLGEPNTLIEKFNVPLLGERTSSLDALKAYSEGKSPFDHGRLADAIPVEKHAMEFR